VMLLMTPAALHRIAFHGEDDASFFEIGSGLVIAASLPLALGIAAAVAVVFFKVTDCPGATAIAGLAALCVLLGVWLAYPLWRRTASRQSR
jgi:hypothetical protein